MMGPRARGGLRAALGALLGVCVILFLIIDRNPNWLGAVIGPQRTSSSVVNPARGIHRSQMRRKSSEFISVDGTIAMRPQMIQRPGQISRFLRAQERGIYDILKYVTNVTNAAAASALLSSETPMGFGIGKVIKRLFRGPNAANGSNHHIPFAHEGNVTLILSPEMKEDLKKEVIPASTIEAVVKAVASKPGLMDRIANVSLKEKEQQLEDQRQTIKKAAFEFAAAGGFASMDGNDPYMGEDDIKSTTISNQVETNNGTKAVKIAVESAVKIAEKALRNQLDPSPPPEPNNDDDKEEENTEMKEIKEEKKPFRFDAKRNLYKIPPPEPEEEKPRKSDPKRFLWKDNDDVKPSKKTSEGFKFVAKKPVEDSAVDKVSKEQVEETEVEQPKVSQLPKKPLKQTKGEETNEPVFKFNAKKQPSKPAKKTFTKKPIDTTKASKPAKKTFTFDAKKPIDTTKAPKSAKKTFKFDAKKPIDTTKEVKKDIKRVVSKAKKTLEVKDAAMASSNLQVAYTELLKSLSNVTVTINRVLDEVNTRVQEDAITEETAEEIKEEKITEKQPEVVVEAPILEKRVPKTPQERLIFKKLVKKGFSNDEIQRGIQKAGGLKLFFQRVMLPDIDKITFKELQVIAKIHGVKANLKKAEMRAELDAIFKENPPQLEEFPVDTPPVPAESPAHSDASPVISDPENTPGFPGESPGLQDLTPPEISERVVATLESPGTTGGTTGETPADKESPAVSAVIDPIDETPIPVEEKETDELGKMRESADVLSSLLGGDEEEASAPEEVKDEGYRLSDVEKASRNLEKEYTDSAKAPEAESGSELGNIYSEMADGIKSRPPLLPGQSNEIGSLSINNEVEKDIDSFISNIANEFREGVPKVDTPSDTSDEGVPDVGTPLEAMGVSMDSEEVVYTEEDTTLDELEVPPVEDIPPKDEENWVKSPLDPPPSYDKQSGQSYAKTTINIPPSLRKESISMQKKLKQMGLSSTDIRRGIVENGGDLAKFFISIVSSHKHQRVDFNSNEIKQNHNVPTQKQHDGISFFTPRKETEVSAIIDKLHYFGLSDRDIQRGVLESGGDYRKFYEAVTSHEFTADVKEDEALEAPVEEPQDIDVPEVQSINEVEETQVSPPVSSQLSKELTDDYPVDPTAMANLERGVVENGGTLSEFLQSMRTMGLSEADIKQGITDSQGDVETFFEMVIPIVINRKRAEERANEENSQKKQTSLGSLSFLSDHEHSLQSQAVNDAPKVEKMKEEKVEVDESDPQAVLKSMGFTDGDIRRGILESGGDFDKFYESVVGPEKASKRQSLEPTATDIATVASSLDKAAKIVKSVAEHDESPSTASKDNAEDIAQAAQELKDASQYLRDLEEYDDHTAVDEHGHDREAKGILEAAWKLNKAASLLRAVSFMEERHESEASEPEQLFDYAEELSEISSKLNEAAAFLQAIALSEDPSLSSYITKEAETLQVIAKEDPHNVDLKDKLRALGLSRTDIERGIVENSGDIEKFYASVVPRDSANPRGSPPLKSRDSPVPKVSEKPRETIGKSRSNFELPPGDLTETLLSLGLSRTDIQRGIVEHSGDLEKFYDSVVPTTSKKQTPKVDPITPKTPVEHNVKSPEKESPLVTPVPYSGRSAGDLTQSLKNFGLSLSDIREGLFEFSGDLERFHNTVIPEGVWDPRVPVKEFAHAELPSEDSFNPGGMSAGEIMGTLRDLGMSSQDIRRGVMDTAGDLERFYNSVVPGYMQIRRGFGGEVAKALVGEEKNRAETIVPKASPKLPSSSLVDSLVELGLSRTDIQRGVMEHSGDLERFYNSVVPANMQIREKSRDIAKIPGESPKNAKVEPAQEVREVKRAPIDIPSNKLTDTLRDIGFSASDIHRGILEHSGDLEKFYNSVVPDNLQLNTKPHKTEGNDMEIPKKKTEKLITKTSVELPNTEKVQRLKDMGMSDIDIKRGMIENSGDIDKFFESISSSQMKTRKKNIPKETKKAVQDDDSVSSRNILGDGLSSVQVPPGGLADQLRAMGLIPTDIQRGLIEHGGDLEKFYNSMVPSELQTQSKLPKKPFDDDDDDTTGSSPGISQRSLADPDTDDDISSSISDINEAAVYLKAMSHIDEEEVEEGSDEMAEAAHNLNDAAVYLKAVSIADSHDGIHPIDPEDLRSIMEKSRQLNAPTSQPTSPGLVSVDEDTSPKTVSKSSEDNDDMIDELRSMGLSEADIQRGVMEYGGDMMKFYQSLDGGNNQPPLPPPPVLPPDLDILLGDENDDLEDIIRQFTSSASELNQAAAFLQALSLYAQRKSGSQDDSSPDISFDNANPRSLELSKDIIKAASYLKGMSDKEIDEREREIYQMSQTLNQESRNLSRSIESISSAVEQLRTEREIADFESEREISEHTSMHKQNLIDIVSARDGVKKAAEMITSLAYSHENSEEWENEIKNLRESAEDIRDASSLLAGLAIQNQREANDDYSNEKEKALMHQNDIMSYAKEVRSLGDMLISMAKDRKTQGEKHEQIIEKELQESKDIAEVARNVRDGSFALDTFATLYESESMRNFNEKMEDSFRESDELQLSMSQVEAFTNDVKVSTMSSIQESENEMSNVQSVKTQLEEASHLINNLQKEEIEKLEDLKLQTEMEDIVKALSDAANVLYAVTEDEKQKEMSTFDSLESVKNRELDEIRKSATKVAKTADKLQALSLHDIQPSLHRLREESEVLSTYAINTKEQMKAQRREIEGSYEDMQSSASDIHTASSALNLINKKFIKSAMHESTRRVEDYKSAANDMQDAISLVQDLYRVHKHDKEEAMIDLSYIKDLEVASNHLQQMSKEREDERLALIKEREHAQEYEDELSSYVDALNTASTHLEAISKEDIKLEENELQKLRDDTNAAVSELSETAAKLYSASDSLKTIAKDYNVESENDLNIIFKARSDVTKDMLSAASQLSHASSYLSALAFQEESSMEVEQLKSKEDEEELLESASSLAQVVVSLSKLREEEQKEMSADITDLKNIHAQEDQELLLAQNDLEKAKTEMQTILKNEEMESKKIVNEAKAELNYRKQENDEITSALVQASSLLRGMEIAEEKSHQKDTLDAVADITSASDAKFAKEDKADHKRASKAAAFLHSLSNAIDPDYQRPLQKAKATQKISYTKPSNIESKGILQKLFDMVTRKRPHRDIPNYNIMMKKLHSLGLTDRDIARGVQETGGDLGRFYSLALR